MPATKKPRKKIAGRGAASRRTASSGGQQSRLTDSEYFRVGRGRPSTARAKKASSKVQGKPSQPTISSAVTSANASTPPERKISPQLTTEEMAELDEAVLAASRAVLDTDHQLDIIHPDQEASDAERLLRCFDMDLRYGPCVGLPRALRYERACHYQLSPPEYLAAMLKPAAQAWRMQHGVGEYAHIDRTI